MKTICVDFDGTLVEDKYPLIGRLKPHAKEVVNFLHAKGHKILIWTCRGRKYEQEAIDFLIENGIKFDYCNNNLPDTVVKYGFESRKLSYDVLIDDRNLNGFVEWNKVIDCLMRQFPEDKHEFCDQTFYKKDHNNTYIKCGELKLELE